MKKLLILIPLFFAMYAAHADAAVFYASLDEFETTCGDGTATTTPFCSLDQFTEVARNRGDILFVKRGNATSTHSATLGDLNFTSDGNLANPITISADYDNLWNQFSTSTQTYTVTQGSKDIIASASTTGITASSTIYVAGDCFENINTTTVNPCEYAYEVKEIVGSTTIRLYLPYKGNQTGAGNSLRVMPSNPIWGAVSVASSFQLNTDNYWNFKGLEIRSSDGIDGTVQFTTSNFTSFIDTIFNGFGANNVGIVLIIDSTGDTEFYIHKCRGENVRSFLGTDGTGNTSINGIISDTYLNLGKADLLGFVINTGTVNLSIIDTEIIGTPFYNNSIGTSKNIFKVKNTLATTSTSVTNSGNISIFYEDKDNIIGQNSQILPLSTTTASQPIIKSTTTPVRTGGAASSIEVKPSSSVSNSWFFSKLKLFEYPIYIDTTSKTYSVFFRSSTSTSVNFLTNPTVDQLWIECEYWNFPANATSTRVVKKSTGTLDFVGDPSNFNSLSVTCQSTNAGILYLRGWYAKTKETGSSNIFFIDPKPVIQ